LRSFYGVYALDNPLTKLEGLPVFSAIRPEHVEPAVRQVLGEQREQLRRMEREHAPSFGCVEELERIHAAVHRVWGPVAHFNAVVSTPPLRDAYNKCLPLITEFNTMLNQSEPLYSLFSRLQREVDPADRTKAQLLSLTLRDFRLAGVALTGKARNQFAELTRQLAQRQAAFEQNLMDATDAFEHHEVDRETLAGLPEIVLRRAKESARVRGLAGWRLTLDPPTYLAVMTHAVSETLRMRYYEAWVTRASDQGPHAGRWSNGALIEEILALRHESARLLGYENYAALSLATKMAGSPEEVFDFLRDLVIRSKPVAERELAELTEFAGRKIEPWDLLYYSEQLKQARFDLSEEKLRPYFPLPRVLAGMFRVAEELFGLRVEPKDGVDAWHPDVSYYEISSSEGRPIGGFFTDLFARPRKRGGAWMDECLIRSHLRGISQAPVAYLVCNFNPPVDEDPSLLTHNDVVTLFHEFGHALHHLLTEVDYPSLAGINGVPWDAVELPSQFFENYAWLPEVLPWISGRHQTGEPLPEETLTRLRASRKFQAGLTMVRQLEFALFDFRLHAEYDPKAGAQTESVLAQVRSDVAVIEAPAFNRFANTFSHVFGGGYAAGYYSYHWAEVLAADAFSAFEEQGSFDASTAEQFRRCILASGGSRDMLEVFRDFRGRSPSLDPLLRQTGIEGG